MSVKNSMLLSIPGMVIWFSLLIIPIIWPLLPIIEGKVLPVVSTPNVLNLVKVKKGIIFYVSFKKYRQCKFISLTWYNKKNERLKLKFEPDHTEYPSTRPVGKQFIGPWFLSTSMIKGTYATVVHQCHPLWKTYTNFYP